MSWVFYKAYNLSKSRLDMVHVVLRVPSACISSESLLVCLFPARASMHARWDLVLKFQSALGGGAMIIA